jgi:hypothetical protein
MSTKESVSAPKVTLLAEEQWCANVLRDKRAARDRFDNLTSSVLCALIKIHALSGVEIN